VHRSSHTTMNITPTPTMTAEQAESRTGLTAREIFTAASESDCGLDLTPKPKFQVLRYQLGNRNSEHRTHHRIPKMRDAFTGNVDVFELIAFGRTWEDAVERAAAKGFLKKAAPAPVAAPPQSEPTGGQSTEARP
jgi:hypothetical protein